ncbi:50S ribosomal protein L11 methyltransferase [Gloeobacter violaceus]|uniref:50S ribosomal protein L11 methyltransferase n=1 Tax=Gloeobacter violaceus TaxID=33072 RepID=UPI0003049530|nr:50S ribosomal protein L11 methyltransferase [Gloeobacter violaceus]
MAELWQVQVETAADGADGEVEETLYWYLSELGLPHVERQILAGRLVLRGYLSGETPEGVMERWREHIRERLTQKAEIGWYAVERRDWQAAWREQWRPIFVGERLVIWPVWLPDPPGDRLVIPLDPGMAFGTGEHATTRLCLRALESVPDLGTFADVGCGSGVLTVAALKLGAGRGWAVDTDDLAVVSTRKNLEISGLEERVTVARGSTEQLSGPLDGVVSNILAEVIANLAPEFRRLVHPGGWGIFSGLLLTQAPRVVEALAGQGFALSETLSEGDWACLVGRFSADRPRSAGS